MLSRAAQINEISSSLGRSNLVTEYINGACVQCKGVIVRRITLDGLQSTVAFYWGINGEKSTKADVFRLTSASPTAITGTL
jgi:hypothetical protein